MYPPFVVFGSASCVQSRQPPRSGRDHRRAVDLFHRTQVCVRDFDGVAICRDCALHDLITDGDIFLAAVGGITIVIRESL